MKAIALISGGMDSILAARLVQQLGIEVIPVYFLTPFCPRPKQPTREPPGPHQLVQINLGVPLHVVDICADFLVMLRNPAHGFGSHINPCIDCKIMMVAKTKPLLESWGASFVISGEVLGQRPMSQHRRALATIDRESGLPGLLLRPLCAQLLPETIAEQKGWVSREKLLRLSGRSRRPQMALVESMGLQKVPNASGGCLLTDPQYEKRLEDLIQHSGMDAHDVELLKYGRHMRLSPQAKLVVGRDEQENAVIASLVKDGDYLFYASEDTAGPTALGRGMFSPELVLLASRITAGYFDMLEYSQQDIMVQSMLAPAHVCKVMPMAREEIARFRI